MAKLLLESLKKETIKERSENCTLIYNLVRRTIKDHKLKVEVPQVYDLDKGGGSVRVAYNLKGDGVTLTTFVDLVQEGKSLVSSQVKMAVHTAKAGAEPAQLWTELKEGQKWAKTHMADLEALSEAMFSE